MAQLTLDMDAPINRERRIDPGEWAKHRAPAGTPQIVVGGPGTGKTQFLCERIAGAIDAGIPPDRILVLGFSRSGIEDIRRRLSQLDDGSSPQVTLATYHSLAMRVVEARFAALGWSQPPAVLTGAEQQQLVADLLRTEDPRDWPPPWRPLIGDDLMAEEVTNFLLRAAEHGLTPSDVEATDRPQWRSVARFAARYEETLTKAHRIDHGQALREAGITLQAGDPMTKAFDVVVADEYQDTNPAQSSMLLSFLAGTDDLLVAADPYQSIYSFRGTDINNVFSFPSDVRATKGEPAERLILTTSMRVPEEILEAAVAVTGRELPGGAGKVLSTRTGGAVACHEFSTRGEEAEWIAADIERIHLAEGIALHRIAVFVRRHSPFVAELTRALERRSISHTQSEERLVDEPVIRFLHDIVTAASSGEEAVAAARRVLLGPFVGLPPGLVSSLPDDPTAWRSWMGSLDGHIAALAELMTDAEWCTERTAPHGLWHAWTSLPQLVAIASDEGDQAARAAWSAYAQVIDRFAERAPGATLADHVNLARNLDYEADALLVMNDGPGVAISTLHQAKGTEYEAVYIADAVEGNLPDLRATDSLLGVRHLNPHLPTETSDYVAFRLDEERRLAYTAMTRATKQVVWTASVPNDDGHGVRPSRFMRSVAPTTPAESADEPLSPGAYHAHLRRMAADPSSALVDRLAALVVLATSPLDGTDPYDRYGVRASGPDTGIVAEDVTLSPSKAHAYERCPRRFAFENYVFSHIDESVYMKLGSVVHDVLEKTERAAIATGRARGNSSEAMHHLDEVWEEGGLGDDAVGRAWKGRAAQLISNLYEGWPSNAVPVDLEVDLPLELDGTQWRGRADRIEANGGSIGIVDYKTGNAVSVEDASDSLQLGYYVLAAMESREPYAEGSIERATFWYPKSPNKHAVATRDFDLAKLDQVRSRLVEIARSVKSESFPPNPGDACRTCPVSGTCPAVPDGAEAFA